MDANLHLSADELKLVTAILDSFSRRAKFPITLEMLLQDWRNFVIEIAQGYNDSFADYTNSLGARDLLEELISQVPPAVQSKLLAALQPWDAMFIEVTKAVEEPLLPILDNVIKKGYWWYRVPSKLGEPPYDLQNWSPYYDHLSET